jgi:hypothetical protein
MRTLSMTQLVRLMSLAIVLGMLTLAACSKELPSSPAGSAGDPVLMTGQPIGPGISRRIVWSNGKVLNRSGFTIYQFRVAMTVYRDDPLFVTVTETSSVMHDSIADKDTVNLPAYELSGDRFIGAAPVYDLLPP